MLRTGVTKTWGTKDLPTTLTTLSFPITQFIQTLDKIYSWYLGSIFPPNLQNQHTLFAIIFNNLRLEKMD
jgi:hypothetical protein